MKIVIKKNRNIKHFDFEYWMCREWLLTSVAVGRCISSSRYQRFDPKLRWRGAPAHDPRIQIHQLQAARSSPEHSPTICKRRWCIHFGREWIWRSQAHLTWKPLVDCETLMKPPLLLPAGGTAPPNRLSRAAASDAELLPPRPPRDAALRPFGSSFQQNINAQFNRLN